MWFQQMESYNLHLTSWVRVMVRKMFAEHKELMNFMAEHDPDSFVQPDATVSVTKEGILWEFFSKKATLGASIHLKEGFLRRQVDEW